MISDTAISEGGVSRDSHTRSVRLHDGGIGYIALMRKPGKDGAGVWQRCLKLDRLVGALPGRTPADDAFEYIGLNAFNGDLRAEPSTLSACEAISSTSIPTRSRRGRR